MDSESRVHPRRRSPRTTATLLIGGDRVHGTVLDMSAKGFFFRPDWGVGDSGYQPMATPTERFHVGDRVEVEMLQDGRPRAGHASVRWVGCSDLYFCHGAGLEVTELS